MGGLVGRWPPLSRQRPGRCQCDMLPPLAGKVSGIGKAAEAKTFALPRRAACHIVNQQVPPQTCGQLRYRSIASGLSAGSSEDRSSSPAAVLAAALRRGWAGGGLADGQSGESAKGQQVSERTPVYARKHENHHAHGTSAGGQAGPGPDPSQHRLDRHQSMQSQLTPPPPRTGCFAGQRVLPCGQSATVGNSAAHSRSPAHPKHPTGSSLVSHPNSCLYAPSADSGG